jgi:hypothetical protein
MNAEDWNRPSKSDKSASAMIEGPARVRDARGDGIQRFAAVAAWPGRASRVPVRPDE